MSAYHLFALVYLVLLSLASTLLTVCDKRNAVKGRRRVPEKTLLLFAAAGGAGAMEARLAPICGEMASAVSRASCATVARGVVCSALSSGMGWGRFLGRGRGA